MKWTCGESRFLVILLWIYFVTKRRFIVLMSAPFGTIALGESFRKIPTVAVTTQELLVTMVWDGFTINKWWSLTQFVARLQKDLDWRHFHHFF